MNPEEILGAGLDLTPDDVEPLLERLGILHRNPPRLSTEEEMREALEVASALARECSGGIATLSVGISMAWEDGLPADIWEPALELVAGTRTPTAAWFLAELTRWPSGGALSRMARVLAADLRSSGIEPEPPPAERFTKGMVSGVDGAGTRRLALFYRTDDNKLRGLDLHLNDSLGLQDVQFTFDDASETGLQLRSPSLMWAPCDIDLGRKILGDTLFLHEEREVPPPGLFLLYRHLLGAKPMEHLPREPDLRAYEMERVPLEPGMADGSESMITYPVYGRLLFSSDEAYQVVRERLREGSRRRGLSSVSQAYRKEFARAVEAAERPTLLRRMGTNLEVEALAGDWNKPINRMAARVWLAIRRKVIRFEDIPYVRRLIDRSIEAILEDLQQRAEGDPEVADVEWEMDNLAREALKDLPSEDSP